MTNEIAAAFDYASLPVNIAGEAREAADRIRERTHAAMFQTGRDLIRVRSLPGMKGRFVEWINAEFGWSEATAYRIIRVVENLGAEFVTVTNFPPTTLYALASPSTPDSVRQEAKERAGAGETVTVAEVEVRRERERVSKIWIRSTRPRSMPWPRHHAPPKFANKRKSAPRPTRRSPSPMWNA